MGIRDYLSGEVAVSPLRKSLRNEEPLRGVLQRSQRKTHSMENFGSFDYDDPGEEEGSLEDEWAIIDQEAEEGRTHTPGYHAKGYKPKVEKSGHPKEPPKHGEPEKRPAGERRLPQGAHRTPPAGYPKDRGQYAIPKWYALPLDTAKRARDAASRFPQMDEYRSMSEDERREVWRRIVRGERRFGIEPGEDVLDSAGLRRKPDR
ncbi:MAG: hypothetical protein M0Z66_05885 [Thermaerobacter sp.]|nr:hypothetical protein [Thermaerobacter sp.]